MFDNLRAEMARRGISVTDLASKIGVSKQTLYRKLHGQSPLSLHEARSIREVLGVDITLDDLFEVTER